MSGFFQALMNQSFLQNALLAGILASIGCGVVGTYVVVKKIGYLAGGIAHAVLGGMGLAIFLGQPPMAGATIAALVAALIIGWVSLRWRQHEDTLIGALWAVGMAIGIIFISKTPGYNVDLMSYLFGNILMVSRLDIIMMTILDLVIILIVFLFYRLFLAVCFDDEFARLQGVPVNLFYLLLLCLTALTVVLLIQVVGLILVIALLTLPAAIAGHHVGSLGRMMVVAVILGALFTSGGLILSYEPDLPAGASIILLAAGGYILSFFGKYLMTRRRRKRTS
ncbi:MAG: metal ABC transporter permease [Candidatus Eisenbacteria bacterium]|uniref:Metal ABC transporter permease n=1 Tax=Eiseniibacteriota bacterium TaxID=2212470 RepID=A0A948W5D8_UNCEI|nr:metal ABC transporter permease [Candidatus Eisenbacteria bacterium]MBU1948606.1 metal ABC transporter permease [Candidatus Eisenbacteria bacterium]MBU2693202.1 metal ABC transporter permease [Candidatus Eisenbacteria bacterium]